MDNCFICNEPSIGQVEFDAPNGKHFRYPFCKSHSLAIATIYAAGCKKGYTECLQETKRILSKKNNLIHSLIRETGREKQGQKEIESLRWDLDELIDRLSTNQY